MRGLRSIVLVTFLVAAWAASASAAPPRATVIGDSVQASFGFAPPAVRYLGRGLGLRVEASVCRKLTSPGCLGGSPESALALVGSLGSALGDVVVVNVGYNDTAGRYDTDAVLNALRRGGVRAVVWVTLRQGHSGYAAINARIRAAARSRARAGMVVRVADWNAYSAGRPWFASDGLHLTTSGAFGLATLLRREVLAALADAGISVGGRPVTERAATLRLGRRATRIAGDRDVLWLASSDGPLAGIDGRSGRRLPRWAVLAAEEDLVSDGRRAWLRDAPGAAITRPSRRTVDLRGPRFDGIGPRPLLARAGAWLWAVSDCVPDGAACATGQVLRGVSIGDMRRQDVALAAGRVRAAAADAGALWLLVERDGGGARLERRDPATGRLLRWTRLPDKAARGALAPARGGAWVLARNGQLLRVGRNARPRKVLGHIRAIAAVDDQVWALKADRRTILNLHPATGRQRGRVSVKPRLSGRMAFTGRHVWILAASGRQAVRIPRA